MNWLGTKPNRKVDVICLVAGVLIVLFWAVPVVITPGIMDWDTDMQRFEAMRRTIVEFGQWPGNNPWIEGGQPLLLDPYIFSIRGFSVLILGTFWGLRGSVAVYLILGFIGAWKLAGVWWQERRIRLIFALFTIANPAAAYMLSVGHIVFLNFWFMPWLLYFLLRVREDKWSGLKAGILFGLAFTESTIYIVQIEGLILAGLFGWFYLCNRKDASAFGRWILLFVPMFGALGFYRFGTVLEIARDYSRVNTFGYHYELNTLLQAYLTPITNLGILQGSARWCGSSWELNSYLGVVSLLLFVVSLKGGFRWWHAVTLVLVWAAIGDDSYWQISYWFHKLPSFDSWLCFTRLRVFIPLFLGVGATKGLYILWTAQKQHRFWHYIVIVLGAVMVGEVLAVSHLIMQNSQSAVTIYLGGDQNPDREFRTISKLQGGEIGVNQFVYEATRMNLGWLNYGDSNLPVHNKDIIKGFDEPGYIAEFYQAGKPVEPVYWSPNRILLQGLDPSIPLVVNMNPGRAWYNNGVQLFPNYRIIEVDNPFTVMPNAVGVVELTYHFPGQEAGVAGSLFFLLLTIVVVGRQSNCQIKLGSC